MNRIISIIAFSMVFLLLGMASAQDRTVVFDFKGIGLDEGSVMAASQIFRSELQATGKFTVVAKDEMESKLSDQGVSDFKCFDVTCASDYGYKLNARYAILGNLSKLGERIVTDVQLISVIDKSIEFSDKFSATSLDDLEMTLRKLATAVANRQKIESEVDRFVITDEETREPRRKKSFITSGAMFGFGFPMGDSYSGVNTLYNLSWVMRYEAGPYVLENLFGGSWGSGDPDTINFVIVDQTNVSILQWDIGMRYVFSRGGDFSPFAGGGIGMHIIGSQSAAGEDYIDGGTAFAIHAAGGLYAFQSYDFRFAVEGKFTMVFSDAFGGNKSTSEQFGIYISITRKFEPGEKRGCMSGGCM